MKNRTTFLLFLVCSPLFLLGQNYDIELDYKVNQDNSVEILYTKNKAGTYTVYLHFPKLVNAHQQRFEKVVKSRKGTLCKLLPIIRKKPIQFSYRYIFHPGKVEPRIDEDFEYLLPFKKNTSAYTYEMSNISEEYLEKEVSAKNWKAYQFEVNKEDTVCSIRKGIVTEIDARYHTDTSGVYNYYRNKNKILIEHDDGTFARYIGFHRDQIFVEEGERVYPQSSLGMLARHDKRDIYRLSIMQFFYNRDNSKDEIRNGIKIRGRITNCITPDFITTDGILNLENEQIYTATFTPEQLMEEMTRREKKQWKKGKMK